MNRNGRMIAPWQAASLLAMCMLVTVIFATALIIW